MQRTLMISLVPAILFAALIYSAFRLHTPAPEAAVCADGGCPLQLDVSDSGKTFVYPVGTQFGIVLDGTTYPQNDMIVNCNPDNTLGEISSVPPVPPPQYDAGFEGVTAGTCTISVDSYSVQIEVQ